MSYFLGSLALLALIGLALWNRLVLRNEQKSESGYLASDSHLKELIGAEGVAITNLRPSGAADFGDRRVDVVADSEYIDKDTAVTVVAVEGSRVVVKRRRELSGA